MRSTTRSTRSAIAGTDDDPLYRSMRQGMSAYRFDVAEAGLYRVDLRFADQVVVRLPPSLQKP